VVITVVMDVLVSIVIELLKKNYSKKKYWFPTQLFRQKRW